MRDSICSNNPIEVFFDADVPGAERLNQPGHGIQRPHPPIIKGPLAQVRPWYIVMSTALGVRHLPLGEQLIHIGASGTGEILAALSVGNLTPRV